MPPYPGEERILTVFADIHYYFTAPTPRPLHHRFDKGSYYYIYYNSTRRSSRLEVANNPGTADQDAFNGYLDKVKLRWSFKFPTLLTLEVDPTEATASPGGQSPLAKDANEWRLASADPRDQGKYMYRLHTLDIYFWTQEDARLVVDTSRRLLPAPQLDFLERPGSASPAHHDSMSPVVQQLESVAVSDPAYRNGQTRNSQSQPSSVPPPPSAAPTTHSVTAGSQNSPQSSKATESPVNYTPIAYNPAAPAAPEPIAHREKTPPPPDAGEGTGLAAAAVLDHKHSMASPPIQPYTGIPGPPSGQPVQASSPWGQPPPAGQGYSSPPSVGHPLQHTASVGSTGSSHAQAISSFSPPPVDPNTHLYGPTSPPMQSPGAQILGAAYGQPQSHAPLQHIQPQYADYLSSRPRPPVGGYAQYSYDQNQTVANPYDVHSQVYRPTEAEANPHIKPSSGGQKPGKFEERADRVEKRVNSFLKKLEKRI